MSAPEESGAGRYPSAEEIDRTAENLELGNALLDGARDLEPGSPAWLYLCGARGLSEAAVRAAADDVRAVAPIIRGRAAHEHATLSVIRDGEGDPVAVQLAFHDRTGRAELPDSANRPRRQTINVVPGGVPRGLFRVEPVGGGSDTAVLVEGFLEKPLAVAGALIEAGRAAAVCGWGPRVLFGRAVPMEHEVIVVPDRRPPTPEGDERAAKLAGDHDRDMTSGVDRLLLAGKRVRLAPAPSCTADDGGPCCADVDDVARRHGTGAMLAMLDAAARAHLSRDGEVQRIAGIANRFERDEAVTAAAKRLGVKASSLASEVSRERRRRRRDRAGVERPDWADELIAGERGGAAPVLYNVALALRRDPAWKGVLGYDRFSQRTWMLQPAPWLDPTKSFAKRPWLDADDIRTAEWMQARGILASDGTTAKAVQIVADDNPFHDVRDYLETLRWDRTKRLDTWLHAYLGAEDTAYTRAVGARWLTAAMARVYEPGCKADTCLVLEGPQGLMKSTALRTLIGEKWFSDQMPDLGSKDAMCQVQGKWVIELAEFEQFNRAEIGRVKSYMSSQVDRFRVPYGRRSDDFPRQCLFAATVNLPDYLKDDTGGRRFWPVKCGEKIDIERLKADREQILAEAVDRYKQQEKWYLDTPELNRAASKEQRERYQKDPWEKLVEQHVAKLDEVEISDILETAIGLSKEKWSRGEANRVGAILRSMGWRAGRASTPDADGKRAYVYTRPPDEADPSARTGAEGVTDVAADAKNPNDINNMSSTSATSVDSIRMCEQIFLSDGRRPGEKKTHQNVTEPGFDADLADDGPNDLKPNGNSRQQGRQQAAAGVGEVGAGDGGPSGAAAVNRTARCEVCGAGLHPSGPKWTLRFCSVEHRRLALENASRRAAGMPERTPEPPPGKGEDL